MQWLVIDRLNPGQAAAINLDRVECISWKDGTMTFELMGQQCVEYECEMSVFVDVVSKLHIVKEIE